MANQVPRQRDARTSASYGPKTRRERTSDWPAVPDLFDVITYFRARGDSYTIIANVGFWLAENPTKALNARSLQRWYETEVEKRRATPKAKLR